MDKDAAELPDNGIGSGRYEQWRKEFLEKGLRDRIAITAMQSLLSNTIWQTSQHVDNLAVHSYTIADAMLKARKNDENPTK